MASVSACHGGSGGEETPDLDAILLRTSGRVLKAQGGRAYTPLGGVQVSLRHPETSEWIPLVRSESDGRFSLENAEIALDVVQSLTEADSPAVTFRLSADGLIPIERDVSLKEDAGGAVGESAPPGAQAGGRAPLPFVLQAKASGGQIVRGDGGRIESEEGAVAADIRSTSDARGSLLAMTSYVSELALERRLPPGLRMMAGAHMERLAGAPHGAPGRRGNFGSPSLDSPRHAAQGRPGPRRTPSGPLTSFPLIRTRGRVPDSVLSQLRLFVLDPDQGWVDRGGTFVRNPRTSDGQVANGYVGLDMEGPDGFLLSGDEAAPALEGETSWLVAQPLADTYTLTGTVVDAEQRPVDLATVLGGGAVALSGADGSFVLDGAAPEALASAALSPRRSHRAGDSVIPVSAEKPGYTSATALANTENPFGLLLVLQPAPTTAAVRGSVLFQDASPAVGASILLAISPGYLQPSLTPYVDSPIARGEATDLEEAEIPASRLAWSVDLTSVPPVRLDAFASSIRLSSLVDGLHRLGLTAQDSDGHETRLEREVLTATDHIVDVVPIVLPARILESVTDAEGAFRFGNVPTGTPAVLLLRGPYKDWQPIPLGPLDPGEEDVQTFTVASDPPAQAIFDAAVLPLLENHQCLTCHSGADPQGGVDLAGAQATIDSLAAHGIPLTDLLGYFSRQERGEIFYWIESVAPELSNTAPHVGPITISPAGTAEVHETISFSAAVSDPEGDQLSVVWTSSLQITPQNPDGRIFEETIAGSGTSSFSLPPTSLALGTHGITVTATDGGGRSSSAQAVLEVFNTPPTASIVSPQADERFCTNDEIQVPLSGSALDPFEAGPALSAEWLARRGDITVSIAPSQPMEPGPEGTSLSNASGTLYFFEGVTEITLKVKDSFTAEATARVEVLVGDTDPLPVITSPPEETVFHRFEPIAFEATVTDECDAAETIFGEWRSNLDGILFAGFLDRADPGEPSAGVSRFTKALSPGRHYITFTAADPGGHFTTANLLVIVEGTLTLSVAEGFSSPGSLAYDNTQTFQDDFNDATFEDLWYPFVALADGFTFPWQLTQEGGVLVTELGTTFNPIPQGSFWAFVGLASRLTFPTSQSFSAQADLSVDAFTFGWTDVSISFMMFRGQVDGTTVRILCVEDTLFGNRTCDLTGTQSSLDVQGPQSVPNFKGQPLVARLVHDDAANTLHAEVLLNGTPIFTETAAWTASGSMMFAIGVEANTINQLSYMRATWDRFATDLILDGYRASLTPLRLSAFDYVPPQVPSTFISQAEPNTSLGLQSYQAVSADETPVLLLSGDQNLNAALVSVRRGGFSHPYQTLYTTEDALAALPLAGCGDSCNTDAFTPNAFLAGGFGSDFTWNLGTQDATVVECTASTPPGCPAYIAPFGFIVMPSNSSGTKSEEVHLDNARVEICPTFSAIGLTGDKPVFDCPPGEGTVFTDDFSTTGVSAWVYSGADTPDGTIPPADPEGEVKLQVTGGETVVSKGVTLPSTWDAYYRGLIYTGFGTFSLPYDQAWKLSFDLRFGASNGAFLTPLPIMLGRALNLFYTSNDADAAGIAPRHGAGFYNGPAFPYPLFALEDGLAAIGASKTFVATDSAYHSYVFEFYPDVRRVYVLRDGVLLINKPF